MEAALENKVVLRHIFSFISLTDLKQCRFVNRTWNFEAGSYLRDFHCCNVNINLCTPCSDLLILNDLARQSAILSINSLRVSFVQNIHFLSSCNHCGSRRNLYAELLEKLSLKHLYVSWDTQFEPKDCPAFQFLVDLFRENTSELRTLEFEHVSPNFRLCYVDENDENWFPQFPKLKELDLGFKSGWSVHEDFLFKIFQVSPKLTKLKGYFDGYMRGIPEDKYPILDRYNLYILTTLDETTCLKVAKAKPALSVLTVTNTFEIWPRQNERYFHVLKQLLTSSWKTLKKLYVNSVKFSFNKLPTPKLVALKKLTLEARAPLQEKLEFLQSIEYPDLMPVLEKVKIDDYFQPQYLSTDLEDYGAPAAELRPSKTVKSLKLTMDVYPLILYRFSEIFPIVNNLNIHPRSVHTESIPYEILWACWPNLEFIYLLEGNDAVNCNFDAAFLGVHPEELDVLKELDDESLERINIVPVRPSIMTMKCKSALQLRNYGSSTRTMLFYVLNFFRSKISQDLFSRAWRI